MPLRDVRASAPACCARASSAEAEAKTASRHHDPYGFEQRIPALRRRHPGLMDFATWLERVGAEKYAAAQKRAR